MIVSYMSYYELFQGNCYNKHRSFVNTFTVNFDFDLLILIVFASMTYSRKKFRYYICD